MEIKKISEQIVFILIFVLLGIATRTLYHIGPNIEFITGSSIAAGYFFKEKRLSFLVPVVTMFISDLIIGNTNIFWFTWSGFLICPLFGIVLKSSNLLKHLKINTLSNSKNTKRKISFITKMSGLSLIMGVVSTMLFFLWTNLGVVLLTNMYPKTIGGLFQSYINAIPFLQNQLAGNMVIVPVIFISIFVLMNLRSKYYSKQIIINS